jgi:hypothetical protein
MHRDFVGSHWTHEPFTVKGKTQQSTIPIDIEGLVYVDFCIRCAEEVVVSAIDKDGQTIYLSSGRVVEYRARMHGIVALEIEHKKPFAYHCAMSAVKEHERLDPRPYKVTQRMGPEQTAAAAADAYIRSMTESMVRRGFIGPDDMEKMADHIKDAEMDFFEDDMDTDFGEHLEMEPIDTPEEPTQVRGDDDADAARDVPDPKNGAPGEPSDPSEKGSDDGREADDA